MTAHTPSQNTFSPYDQIRELWEQHQWLYVIAGFLLGVLFAPMIRLMLADGFAFVNSLVPEAVGILFTVLILNQLAERRSVRELQEQLIREVGGRANDTALAALDHMREQGWLHLLRQANLNNAKLDEADLSKVDLTNVSMMNVQMQKANLRAANLAGAYLWRADLEGAELSRINLNSAELGKANLRGVNLGSADLEHAELRDVNLKCAKLGRANLKYAILRSVNFQEADLWLANLEGVDLRYADLQDATLRDCNLSGAILRRANLLGANLASTTFNEQTVLPDANHNHTDENGNPIFDNYWTPDTDMTRYTDPNHPDFWQPDWVKAQEGE